MRENEINDTYKDKQHMYKNVQCVDEKTHRIKKNN